MKKIVLTIAMAGLVASAYSQGQISFENLDANGYVVESSAPDTTANAGGTYVDAPSFTATLWAIETPTSSDSGLTGLDAYGDLNLSDLVSDGFVELATSGSVSDIASSSAGAFGSPTMLVPGVAASETVFCVVCWTGVATTLAAAEATPGDYIGDLTFVNDTAGAPPSGLTPGVDDTSAGWDGLANSPRSNAEGGDEDLVMTAVPVPEPATLAFAGLGGLSVLLFRRRK
jgi:PEP-CTERM motif